MYLAETPEWLAILIARMTGVTMIVGGIGYHLAKYWRLVRENLALQQQVSILQTEVNTLKLLVKYLR